MYFFGFRIPSCKQVLGGAISGAAAGGGIEDLVGVGSEVDAARVAAADGSQVRFAPMIGVVSEDDMLKPAPAVDIMDGLFTSCPDTRTEAGAIPPIAC
jgi:hypothetical protein